MGGRFENFTPPTLGSELSTSEITMVEELTALANSGTGEFIRKSAGSLVNATLSETIALSGLSDVAISSPASGQVLSYNGSSWVNSSLSETISLSELDDVVISSLAVNNTLRWNGSSWVNAGGVGTVTSVSVVTANGVSGSVADSTATPAITLTLGAITPTTVNGLTITANGTNTLNVAAGKTLTVSNTLTLTATDGSTLAIGTGGTLGSAAYTASTAYAAALGADDNYVTDAEKTALHASGSDDTFTVANEATDTTCFPLFVTATTGDLGPKTNAGLAFNSNTGLLTVTGFSGPLTGNVTGNVTGSAATVTGAAQAAITSLGTLTTLTIDDITINGNTISSAGASSLAITPTAGQAILLDATISIDAGVVTGATSITSTTFVGALTGTASGNLTSGGALGTPSSGTLTNCTGLPVAGLVALTASEIVGTTAGGVLTSLAVATYPSLTELTYVKGVTSAIQTQLGTKVTSGGALGTPSSGTGTNITGIPAANILAGSFGAGAYVISTSLQAATIELGHATDTTLSRSAAGVLAVEGVVIPSISSTNTLTNKRITSREGTVADSATPTPASDDVDIYTVTALAQAATFGAPTGTPTQGQKLIIRIKDNATARALSWNAIYRAGTDVALPTTTVLSKTMYLGFIYNSTDTKWDLLAKTDNI